MASLLAETVGSSCIDFVYTVNTALTRTAIRLDHPDRHLLDLKLSNRKVLNCVNFRQKLLPKVTSKSYFASKPLSEMLIVWSEKFKRVFREFESFKCGNCHSWWLQTLIVSEICLLGARLSAFPLSFISFRGQMQKHSKIFKIKRFLILQLIVWLFLEPIILRPESELRIRTDRNRMPAASIQVLRWQSLKIFLFWSRLKSMFV